MGPRARTTITAIAAIIAVLAAFAGGAWWWANRQFEKIPTFDDPLPSASPVQERRSESPAPSTTEPRAEGITTIAVFSTGSAGVDTNDADRLGIGADRLAHSDGLTDSIAIIAIDATNRHVTLLSIPRDTWIDSRGARINATYNGDGAAAFAHDLTDLTGIGIDHMIAANFTAAADIVDALGGVWASTGVPVRDTNSGLALDGSCTRIDGATALAWTRARHLQAQIDGRWRSDGTGDLGRIERQQQLVATAIAQLGWASVVQSTPALLDAAAANLTRDEGLTLAVVARLAAALRSGAELETITPAAAPTRRGAASVVTITDQGDAQIAELAARISAGDLTPSASPHTADGTGGPTTEAAGSDRPAEAAAGSGPPPETGTSTNTTSPQPVHSSVTLTPCTPS